MSSGSVMASLEHRMSRQDDAGRWGARPGKYRRASIERLIEEKHSVLSRLRGKPDGPNGSNRRANHYCAPKQLWTPP